MGLGRFMLTDTRYHELLDEATVDCYGEEEEFSGVLNMLMDNLNFPLRATLAGAPVTVHGLDEGRSTLRRGIVATIERSGETYHVSLADLIFVHPDDSSAEWLELVRRWSGMPS